MWNPEGIVLGDVKQQGFSLKLQRQILRMPSFAYWVYATTLALNHPAAGLDRVRRRKGVASAAAPHPCPRLMFCERRRRGAGAVGAPGQGSPPAAAVAKGSQGGHESISETTDYFRFHSCWL